MSIVIPAGYDEWPPYGQYGQVKTITTGSTLSPGNAIYQAPNSGFGKMSMLPHGPGDWTIVLQTSLEQIGRRVVRPRKQRQPKLLPVPGRTGRAIRLSGPLTD